MALSPTRASYAAMCEQFGVHPTKVRRPTETSLLISMQEASLHPMEVKTIGDMVLYEGPLGKTFGGRWPNLKFTQSKPVIIGSIDMPSVTSYPTWKSDVDPQLKTNVLCPECKKTFYTRRDYLYHTLEIILMILME